MLAYEGLGIVAGTREHVHLRRCAHVAGVPLDPPQLRPLRRRPLERGADASGDITGTSRESVTASLPRITSRATNGDPAANSCENFTFHGHILREMCRYNRFMVEVDMGLGTVEATNG